MYRFARFAMIWILLVLSLAPASLAAQTIPAATDEPAIDWLEPKGLNIVDLVGQAPDAHLRNAMVVFSAEGGAQYLSGRREGDEVTIEARIYTKEIGGVSYTNCLGQWGHLDQWASAMPAGSVRFYFNGGEITDRAHYISYYPAGIIQPSHGTGGNRYDRTSQIGTTFNDDGSLRLEANTGCIIALMGSYPAVDATFTFTYAPPIQVEVLGQEEFVFHTYIGPGEAGAVNSLRRQMASRFGNRHDKFAIHPPAGADYMFVHYPPNPVSAYGNGPVTNPSSGTYRLAQGQSILSTDHVVSMGVPLLTQWRDSDQNGGARYLPEIDTLDTLTAPEYFVPAGFAYDPCMTNGGCSDALLDAIHDAEMTLTVHYYRVSRSENGLTRIPLRMVGSRYSGRVPAGQRITAADDEAIWNAPVRLFIASVRNGSRVEPDDSDGCPCGWFTADGRMVDYIPRP